METEVHHVDFGAGCHISNGAAQLVAAATEHGAAAGTFNGIKLLADPTSTVDGIVRDYTTLSNAARETYLASPEGIAAAEAADERRSNMQAKHDALMRSLAGLDFSNQVTVLDWLCEMQEPSDHVGVIVRRKTVLEAFAKHGFRPGVNCDADFRPESRENVHRWLVGQALDGLEKIAIHSLIHKFASDWKAKFAPTCQRMSKE
jgi:hypothetical protein